MLCYWMDRVGSHEPSPRKGGARKGIDRPCGQLRRCALLITAMTLGCVHGVMAVPPDGESIAWPGSVSPTRLVLAGEALQAINAAASDFRPHGMTDRYDLPRQKCLASQAAYDYEVVHDAQQELYFVRVRLNEYCKAEAFHMEADYAIDDRTWSIRGRRLGSEVPVPLAPAYAALVVSDCAACDAPGSGFDYGFTAVPRDHTFYVRNIGGRPATEVGDGGKLGEGFAYKDGTYPGTGGTCGSSLAAGDLCTMVVTFDPARLAHEADLALAYHDGFTRRIASYSISGVRTDVARVSIGEWPVDAEAGRVDLGKHDFGQAGIPVDHSFHVWNIGAKTATGLRDGGGMDRTAFHSRLNSGQ